ncbi:MAG TPA: NAD(+)--rifampin ADP-ribosyltransferase [Pyrinomonadaceae bacterium]|nr:NAD(+)--rifampin ADP-ribosyltransferase [Pyrinomonadaceae bacterium]
MNDKSDELSNKRFFHGTRAELSAGDSIEPSNPSDVGKRDSMATHVFLTPNLDEAIWDAELAIGEGAPRVYTVGPTGQIGNASDLPDWKSPGHPSMSFCSREPLQVTGEVTVWRLYHGTRADLKPGDLIKPGYKSNYGKRTKAAHVYFARTVDAATWGAELAAGEGRGRIYIVEPTGPIEDDPDLTNKKFRGNPTKAYRSQEPLRVTGEIKNWHGHSPEKLKAMKDFIEQVERLGAETVED